MSQIQTDVRYPATMILNHSSSPRRSSPRTGSQTCCYLLNCSWVCPLKTRCSPLAPSCLNHLHLKILLHYYHWNPYLRLTQENIYDRYYYHLRMISWPLYLCERVSARLEEAQLYQCWLLHHALAAAGSYYHRLRRTRSPLLAPSSRPL